MKIQIIGLNERELLRAIKAGISIRADKVYHDCMGDILFDVTIPVTEADFRKSEYDTRRSYITFDARRSAN